MGEHFWPEGCILLPLILLYVTPGVSLLQGNQERTPHKEQLQATLRSVVDTNVFVYCD